MYCYTTVTIERSVRTTLAFTWGRTVSFLSRFAGAGGPDGELTRWSVVFLTCHGHAGRDADGSWRRYSISSHSDGVSFRRGVSRTWYPGSPRPVRATRRRPDVSVCVAGGGRPPDRLSHGTPGPIAIPRAPPATPHKLTTHAHHTAWHTLRCSIALLRNMILVPRLNTADECLKAGRRHRFSAPRARHSENN